ncbi:hypothetical protein LINPERHAP1_LOCUS26757 [Linum perenne]
MDSPIIRYLRGAAAAARSPTSLSQYDIEGGDAEYAFCSPSPMAKKTTGSKSRGVTSFGRSPSSLSSLSSLENVRKSSVFAATPLKAMEDDVFVMDEIGVVPATGASRVSSKTRVLSESFGSSSNISSSSSSGNRINKTELCRSWIDHGYCRYATKCQAVISHASPVRSIGATIFCFAFVMVLEQEFFYAGISGFWILTILILLFQFAHGKEEVHPPGFIGRNKSEVNTVRNYRALTPPSYPRDTKSLFFSPGVRETAATGSQRRLATDRHEHSNKAIFMKSELYGKNTTGTSTLMLEYMTINPIQPKLDLLNQSSTSIKKPQGFGNISSTNTSTSIWSPLDDNIDIILPPCTDNCTSREDANAYIDRILHGPPATRKRLPVFSDLCP